MHRLLPCITTELFSTAFLCSGEAAGMQAGKDIRGGRLQSDRSAANSAAGKAFTALQYSADGAMLFAGGSTKWVCVYDVAERVLLQKFQLSKNLALDGVLDTLNSRNMTDAGPLALLDIEDDEDQQILPVATAGSIAGAEKLPGASSLLHLHALQSVPGMHLVLPQKPWQN
jgi:hypothetical protein